MIRERIAAGEGAYGSQSLYMSANTDERRGKRFSRLSLMAHPHSSPPSGEAPTTSQSSAERATLIGTLVHLWPYIWPSDRADLKMRVVWSVVLLLIAKLATLAVPFTFKWATDALSGKGSAPFEASNWVVWVVASPLLMVASYGALRVVMVV